MESSSKLINQARQNDTLTDNGAVTNSTSLNSVVDLFFIAGASRTMPEADIHNMLAKSWAEDSLLTLKTIFWASDVRGGAGERRFCRIALKWLEERYTNALVKNLPLVPHFNRWDSLFHLGHAEVFKLIYDALVNNRNGLCAKWMPRKKQYSNFADAFRRYYNMTPRDYRHLIVSLSKTVEQQMCGKKWPEINYEHVPSVAFNKYRKAFARNDAERFTMFLGKVEKGEAEIKAGAIFPYDIYNSYKNLEEVNETNLKSINLQWSALPNYMQDNSERILPICDVSGSMSGLPLSISVSLGIYISERNKGLFENAFVTFSATPTIQYLKGSLTERMDQLEDAQWDCNTDLNAVFKVLLKTAKVNNLPESEMPTMLLIISDMEFDSCAELTNYEAIEQKYTEAGYKIPKIVFWNVNGRQGNVPVCAKQKGVALVSGSSPSILKSILAGKDFSPVSIMLETLNNERYSQVAL
jgi:hypothetical protein